MTFVLKILGFLILLSHQSFTSGHEEENSQSTSSAASANSTNISINELPNETLYNIAHQSSLDQLLLFRQLSRRFQMIADSELKSKLGHISLLEKGVAYNNEIVTVTYPNYFNDVYVSKTGKVKNKVVTIDQQLDYIICLGKVCVNESYEYTYHFLTVLNLMKLNSQKKSSIYSIEQLSPEAHTALEPLVMNQNSYSFSENQVDGIFNVLYNHALAVFPDILSKIKLINLKNFNQFIVDENLFYNPERSVRDIKTLIQAFKKDDPQLKDVYFYALSKLNNFWYNHSGVDNSVTMQLLNKGLADTGSILFKIICGNSSTFPETPRIAISSCDEPKNLTPERLLAFLNELVGDQVTSQLSEDEKKNFTVEQFDQILKSVPPRFSTDKSLTLEEDKDYHQAIQNIDQTVREHVNDWYADDERFDHGFNVHIKLKPRQLIQNYLSFCEAKTFNLHYLDSSGTPHYNSPWLNNRQGFWDYIKEAMDQKLIDVIPNQIYEDPDYIHPGESWFEQAVDQIIQTDHHEQASACFRFFHHKNGFIPFEYLAKDNKGTKIFLGFVQYGMLPANYNPTYLQKFERYLIQKGMPQQYILRNKDLKILERTALTSEQRDIINNGSNLSSNDENPAPFCGIGGRSWIGADAVKIADNVHIKDSIYSGCLFVKAKKVILEDLIDAIGGMVIVAEEFSFKRVKLWQINGCHLIRVPKIDLSHSMNISL